MFGRPGFKRNVMEKKVQNDKKANLLRPTDDKSYDVVSGSKYSRYGQRAGIGSLLDQNVVQSSASNFARKYGGGSVSFKPAGDEAAIQNATLNIGGRIFKPNSKSEFRIVDGKYLEEVTRIHEEKEEYVNDLTYRCSISDAVCSEVLGLVDTDFEKILGQGGLKLGETEEARINAHSGAEDLKALGVPRELWAYNAKPSFLRSMDSSNTAFSMGLSKLRSIVMAIMPIVDGLTPEMNKNITVDNPVAKDQDIQP